LFAIHAQPNVVRLKVLDLQLLAAPPARTAFDDRASARDRAPLESLMIGQSISDTQPGERFVQPRVLEPKVIRLCQSTAHNGQGMRS
jgi:hypothetical protein